MEPVTLYHNPRCSKSRAALALLEENEVDIKVVYYLDSPLGMKQIKGLLKKLNVGIRDLIRKSEPEYDELGLDDQTLADEILIDILSRHPRLMQRPIVVRGERAVIGRPPENVLEFIKD